MPVIGYGTLQSRLHEALLRAGFAPAASEKMANVFSESTFDGVFSHGVNRFPRFVGEVRSGVVDPRAVPAPIQESGALEQWDGHRGAGILNALACTERAMELAGAHGLGCVALRNTNHWMRGGTYGWKAAGEGFLFTGWTNTMPNMPPWGGTRAALGNNPLVWAVPNGDAPVVLDMSMSQYSYGKLEWAKRSGTRMPEYGGYTDGGELTRDPNEILDSGRILPSGLWKGAGLSLVLDLAAALVSGGRTVSRIGELPAETELSQVFLCINLETLGPAGKQEEWVRSALSYIGETNPGAGYPGKGTLERRKTNHSRGVDIPDELWREICDLSGLSPGQ